MFLLYFVDCSSKEATFPQCECKHQTKTEGRGGVRGQSPLCSHAASGFFSVIKLTDTSIIWGINMASTWTLFKTAQTVFPMCDCRPADFSRRNSELTRTNGLRCDVVCRRHLCVWRVLLFFKYFHTKYATIYPARCQNHCAGSKKTTVSNHSNIKYVKTKAAKREVYCNLLNRWTSAT